MGDKKSINRRKEFRMFLIILMVAVLTVSSISWFIIYQKNQKQLVIVEKKFNRAAKYLSTALSDKVQKNESMALLHIEIADTNNEAGARFLSSGDREWLEKFSYQKRQIIEAQRDIYKLYGQKAVEHFLGEVDEEINAINGLINFKNFHLPEAKNALSLFSIAGENMHSILKLDLERAAGYVKRANDNYKKYLIGYKGCNAFKLRLVQAEARVSALEVEVNRIDWLSRFEKK